MGEIDAADLLPSEHVRKMAAQGDLTQLHRGQQYAEAGDAFEVDGQRFEVTDVVCHRFAPV